MPGRTPNLNIPYPLENDSIIAEPATLKTAMETIDSEMNSLKSATNSFDSTRIVGAWQIGVDSGLKATQSNLKLVTTKSGLCQLSGHVTTGAEFIPTSNLTTIATLDATPYYVPNITTAVLKRGDVLTLALVQMNSARVEIESKYIGKVKGAVTIIIPSLTWISRHV